MFDHVTIAVSDLKRSRYFYAGALAPLGYAIQTEITDEHTGALAAIGLGTAASHPDQSCVPSADSTSAVTLEACTCRHSIWVVSHDQGVTTPMTLRTLHWDKPAIRNSPSICKRPPVVNNSYVALVT